MPSLLSQNVYRSAKHGLIEEQFVETSIPIPTNNGVCCVAQAFGVCLLRGFRICAAVKVRRMPKVEDEKLFAASEILYSFCSINKRHGSLNIFKALRLSLVS